MVRIEAVQRGMSNYLDKNLLTQMTTAEKVLKGALIGICLNGLPNIINEYISKTGLDKIGVIVDGKIDIDIIKNSFVNQLNQVGSISIDVPMIGRLTIDSEEVEKCYQEILRCS